MGLIKMLIGEEPTPFQDWFHRNDEPGAYGEWLTEYALTNNGLFGANTPGLFAVIRNVYIPWKGKSAEIDLLMLHEKGIFVFESKNFSGTIYGHQDEFTWRQYLPGSRETNTFYNPIRQNQTHIQALSALLQLPEEVFTSFIVFSNRCQLGGVPDDTERVKIVHRDELVPVLRRQLRHMPLRYTPDEIADMTDAVMAAMPDRKAQDHVQDIAEKCPYCGGRLVKKYSQKNHQYFIGCECYPRCRYTRKLP